MGRKGTMTEKTIDSNYLQEEHTIKIYQPETFSPLYRYNICIMQDGNDYFQMGRVATFSDRLHEDGNISNTVFVGIHYKNRQDRRNKYHPNGKEHEAYTKFIVHELVPLLDEMIPSNQLGSTRALMGDSLAGTFALVTALTYPNTFGKVIMHSPYIDEAVLQLVRDSEIDFSTIDFYHIIGTREDEAVLSDGKVEDLLTPNRELNHLLNKKGANYTYHEIEDGNHTWKYWQKDMPHTLSTMFNDLD
ncbi:esterase family protein [Oceanobacillus piezotolerans]|uniref:Esterase family protein n=1 Tax=Oceanobacillus piezotolerans TaxID=2448030 RepID=A0A498DBH3_9BACI|nr:alpha/beta hydrolase-fold protein [Oceanobacillus piezotolerans]RLL45083.1 esterase family protein [Oceanobacillus piezotolerans]